MNSELKEREKAILNELKNVGINRYFSDTNYKDFFTNLAYKLKNIMHLYRVESIWFTIEGLYSTQTYMNLCIVDYNYNDTLYTTSINTKDIKMSDRMLKAVLDSLEVFIKERKEKIKNNLAKPNIEDCWDLFLEYANKAIKKYKNHSVSIKTGKLNYEGFDTEPYKVLAVYEKNCKIAIGTIVFDKSKYGDYSIIIRMPLSGSRSINCEFEEYEDYISDAIKYICD